jgi:hypothetical protein
MPQWWLQWSLIGQAPSSHVLVESSWNGRVHLNRPERGWGGRQFSRLLAAEVCASAVVILDTPRSELVWRVLATHSILQFPLHFPSRASPCAVTFQLDYNPLHLIPGLAQRNLLDISSLHHRLSIGHRDRVNGKANPLQAWTGFESSRSLGFADFKTIGTWRW